MQRNRTDGISKKKVFCSKCGSNDLRQSSWPPKDETENNYFEPIYKDLKLWYIKTGKLRGKWYGDEPQEAFIKGVECKQPESLGSIVSAQEVVGEELEEAVYFPTEYWLRKYGKLRGKT